MKLVNDNVYVDFRDNIFFDKDNPVLAMKANRDRYGESKNQKIYAGLPQIGSLNSEDALIWNIFRELIPRDGLNCLETVLNLKLTNPKILLWTLSFSQESNELQYIVGNYIRGIDGKHKGQITEPDVIIDTDDYFILAECKLGEKKYSVCAKFAQTGSDKKLSDPVLQS